MFNIFYPRQNVMYVEFEFLLEKPRNSDIGNQTYQLYVISATCP